MSLEIWYHVSFDEEYIYPNSDIIRICFQIGDFLQTDELYIFTSEREASYLIPIDADGGSELWGEIIERDFFDAGLAIKVATGLEGLHCWPEDK